MKSATVNPMPAVMPMPVRSPHPTSSARLPSPERTARNDPTSTPSGFPSTSPKKTPRETGAVSASPSRVSDSSTPAFARAKIGRITKLVHGSNACSVRASGETASRESHARRIHH